MADIQYLNYGDLQIELLALLNNLANNVQSYVESQSWSKSRKEKFMSAYQDIMNRGLLGASNASGLWVLNVGGDDFGFDNMDRKSREMYQEAAYFIQQQMSSLPTKASLEEDEEKKKKELPLFDNKYFTTNFLNQLSKDWFGGRPFDTQGDWNSLDARGENGRRGRKVRADRLARSLETYVNSLDETKLNFEGSPFSDLNDFKTRVNEAVAALRTESPDDDLDALNRIGLRASDYFNDGSGDIYGTDREGNSITYGQYYDAQSKLQEEERQAKLKAEQDAFNLKRGVILPIGGIHGTDARTNPEGYQKFIAETYGTGQAGYNKINEVILSLLNKGLGMTASDKKLLGNFLYYIRQNNPAYQNSGVSNEEYAELMKHNSLKGKRQLDFIRFPWKVNGLDIYGDNQGNIYYVKNDRTSSNGVIENPRLKFDRNKLSQYKRLFLMNTPSGIDKQQLDYLKSTGFNDADIAELGGILLDITSIVDPEPWSAGITGVLAAGARNYARLQDPKKWDISDYLWQGVDYLTGAAGAIPGLGDSALAYKAVKSIGKIGKKMLTIPAVYEMLSESPDAYKAIQKAIKGEDLTVEDYRHVGLFIRGLTGTRNITVQNRAARRALEKRGYDLSNLNSWLKKTGLIETNVPTSLSTVKVSIKGETKEIPISSLNKKDLDAKLKKAGNDLTKKAEEIRKTPEVSEYIKKNNLKPEDISAIESNSIRNTRVFGNRIGILPSRFRTTSANYGSTTNVNRGNDTFEQYLSGDRGLWDRFVYGSNRTLRGMDKLNNGVTKTNETKDTNESLNNVKHLGNKPSSILFRGENNRQLVTSRAIMHRWRNIQNGKFSKRNITTGKLNIGDEVVTISPGTKKGIDITTSKETRHFKSQEEAKKFIASIVKEQRNKITSGPITKLNVEKIGKVLQDLKRKGWLKQGGIIDRLKIQKYKEFISK